MLQKLFRLQYLLILLCFLALPPSANAQQAKLVYAGMAQDVPPGATPGQLINVGFNLNNVSGIDANNYTLLEYGTNYGTGSATYPPFSIASGATGTAWVNSFPVPAQPATVFFVVIDETGTPLSDLSGGKLFIDFFGGGALCEEPPLSGADTIAPLITNVIAQSHGGEFFIQANVTDGCGVNSVVLEINGDIYTLLPDPSDPTLFSTRVSVSSNQTLDYRLIATDLAGNAGVWDPTRGYVAYSAASGQLGFGYAGYNGLFYGPRREHLPCGANCGQSISDPVNTVNGNLVDRTYLLEIPGRLPINFHLTFNNQGGKETIFGLNMTHPYNYYVVEMDNQFFTGAFLHYPDGHVVVFEDFQAEPGYYETLKKTGSGYELSFTNLNKVIFNSDGDIERYQDHNGNGLNFSYSDISEYTLRSKLGSIQADGGREITFSYNSDDLVATIVAPEGKTLRFSYEESQQDQGDLTPFLLTEFVDGNGGKTKFVYDEVNNLLEKVSPKGHPYFVNVFDDERRVIRQSIGSDFSYDFTYTQDPSDETVVSAATAIDANGHEVGYGFTDGLLTTRTDQNGNTEHYTYTADKEVETYTDKNGNVTQYGYDSLGNTTSVTDALSQVIDQTFNPTFSKPAEVVYKQSDHVTQYGYDSVGNLSSVKHALGAQQIMQYDSLGQLVERNDFNGNTTLYTYTREGDVESITQADGGVERFVYDDLGRVTAYSDARNNQYSYTYDLNDNLLSVQGPLGYNISYTYDANNHGISYTDANSGTSTYEFDDKENKILERDQLGFEKQSIFGPMNELLAEIDEESVRTHYGYDPAYRLIEKTEAVFTADQRQTAYGYDPYGNVVSITDPEGRVLTQEFDVLHRRSAVIRNANGNSPDVESNVTTRFTYSPTDSILRVLDANGNPIDYEYDPLDRLISQTDAESQTTAYSYDAQSNRTSLTNPRGYVTTFSYDGMNRLATMTDARGGNYQFDYDLNSNRIQEVDANGVATAFDFDALNRRIATIRGFNSGAGSVSDTNVTTQYAYDLHGNVVSLVNPRGHTTSFAYDSAHRTTEITDALGQRTEFSYNKVDKVLSVNNRRGHTMRYEYDQLYRIVKETNEEGHSDDYTYDKVDNVLTFLNKRNIAHSYSYDPLDRLKAKTDPYSNSVVYEYDAIGNILSTSDENGHTDQYAYDLIYRRISETDAEGFITQYQFDENSNLVEKIDAENNPTQYSFDELDRLVSVLNAENEQEQYDYDALRNITQRTEADGTNHDFSYDKLYRLVEVVNNAKGGAANNDTNVLTRYRYDPNGNLTRQIDPNVHETSFAYDPLDRLTTEINPIGNTWRYSYDPEGNVTTRTDANGIDTTYAYYPDHKLQTVTYPKYAVNFAYNETNFPIEMVDQLGRSAWDYDLLDRMVSQRDPLSNLLAYAYDPVGNLTSLTYPDNRSIAHTYLKNDWLKISATNEQDNVAITRNKVGAPVHFDRSNATTTDIIYDRVYRALNVKDQQLGGSLITQFAYSYNPIGHIAQEVANYGWQQPSQVTTTFSYDELHRLTREQNTDDLNNTFSYDPAGNRLAKREKIKQGFTTSTYDYDKANRMLSIDVSSNHPPANAQHTLEYDANGNRINQLIKSNGVDRGVFYAYDTENRLTQHQSYQVSGGGSDNGSGSGPCNAGNGKGNGNGCNNNGNGQDNNNTNGKGNKYGHAKHNSGGGLGNPSGNATLNSVLLKAHTDLEYDGIGRRLISTYYPSASNSGKRTEFTFDRRDPVVEYSVWNQHKTNLYRDTRQNLLFKHRLTAGNRVTSGNRFFFHHDGQGNVSALSKHQGQADKSYRYEAYGNILHPSSNAAVKRNGYSLSQKRFDGETELYYFGARHYDALTGAWLTQDSYRGEVSDPQSLHRYMYNYDSPVNYVDPYGEFGLVGALVGAGIDLALQGTLVATGIQDDIDWVSVGVSAAAGATGVGLLSVATKAKKFKKVADVARVASRHKKTTAVLRGSVSNISESFVYSAIKGEKYTVNCLLSDGVNGGYGAIIAGGLQALGGKSGGKIAKLVAKRTGLETRGYKPAPGERTIQGQVDAATKAGNPTVQRGGQDLFRLRSSGHEQSGATATPQNTFRTNPKTGERFGPQAGPDRAVTTRDIKELYKGQTNHGTSDIRTRVGR